MKSNAIALLIDTAKFVAEYLSEAAGNDDAIGPPRCLLFAKYLIQTADAAAKELQEVGCE